MRLFLGLVLLAIGLQRDDRRCAEASRRRGRLRAEKETEDSGKRSGKCEQKKNVPVISTLSKSNRDAEGSRARGLLECLEVICVWPYSLNL